MVKIGGFGGTVLRRLSVAFLLLAIMWVVAWISALSLNVREPLDRADVIVVLSGAATILERASLAAQLYGEGKSRRIVITNDNVMGGWSETEQRNPYSFERATAVLKSGGTPESAIDLIQQPVFGTDDEAVMLRKYCEKHGVKSIMLVTSAYHSRRALWTFRREFRGTAIQIGIEPVPTGFQTPPPSTWWLHLSGWKIVPTEYLKFIAYRVSFG
jgi:uncharacterized SAM-binding protein YcdF (DUF218 family)